MRAGRRAGGQRSGARSLAMALDHLALDAHLLQLRQMIDEHDAFQMIHLVLDAHREQLGRLQLERCATGVLRPHLDVRGAAHVV